MTGSSAIYLDYAAATPLDPRVEAAMQPYLTEHFYNPSSTYLAGRQVRQAIEGARERVAHWLGARSSEIIFTAGATESINLAIHGVLRQFPEANMVVSPIDHDAVLSSARHYAHHVATVSSTGLIEPAELESIIDDHTVLLSIGYANNEIGTIQPLRDVARIVASVRAKRRAAGNALPLYLHTDASQAAGYLDLQVARLGVDLLTLSASKIYGPKQTGTLFVKAGIQLAPLINGGGQERNLRSGTENVPGVIGLATALDLAQSERKAVGVSHALLRDELQHRLQAAFPDLVVNGAHKKRLPNNLHVSWPGIDGERLVMLLDERGVQAATGAACAASKQTASHVLRAIGLEEELLAGSLRLSIGAPTTSVEIDRAATIIVEGVRAEHAARTA